MGEGWTYLWAKAGPEVRRDADGHLRRFEDFSRTYGTQQGRVKWQAAEQVANTGTNKGWVRRLWSRRMSRNSKAEFHGERGEPVSACLCKSSNTKHGTCGFHFNLASAENQPWCRTKYGCGFPSPSGSWYYCDVRGVERRCDDDGYFYNAKEFRDHYNYNRNGLDRAEGKRKYEANKRHVERRQCSDGNYYTAGEFRAFYIDELGEEGWVQHWAAAGPERRHAADGSLYTFEQFKKHYGAKNGLQLWDAGGQNSTRVADL